MSSNDRRAGHMSAPRPRVASNRVDADRPSRGAASPLQDNMDPMRTSSSSQKHRVSRDQKNMSEKRTERTVITTREKAVRRNPAKEFNVNFNVSEWENPKARKPSKADGASPGGKKREPVPENGQSSHITRVAYCLCFESTDIDNVCYSTMESTRISDSSLDGSARL